MEFNLLGLAAGITTFLGVWMGHLLVRKLEFQSSSLTLPAACFALIGIALEFGSLLFNSPLFSAILGILGITVLWDALELFRQQKRVIRGRAPANPSNPRHARLLQQYSSATTINLLNRDPVGRMVSAEEALRLVGKMEKER